MGKINLSAYSLQKGNNLMYARFIIFILLSFYLNSLAFAELEHETDSSELQQDFNQIFKLINQADILAINDTIMSFITTYVADDIDYLLFIKIAIGFVIFILLLTYHIKKTKLLKDTLKQIKNELALKNTQLEKMTVMDPLTQLYNQQKLGDVIQQEIERASRYSKKFALVIADIDNFRQVNDIHGHQTGDKVLKEIALILQSCVRKTDTLGRWGGEEFMILCPETNESGVLQFAEILRSTMETNHFSVVKRKTASFGVTAWQEGDTMDSMTDRANKALSQAKEEGRNRAIYL